MKIYNTGDILKRLTGYHNRPNLKILYLLNYQHQQAITETDGYYTSNGSDKDQLQSLDDLLMAYKHGVILKLEFDNYLCSCSWEEYNGNGENRI